MTDDKAPADAQEPDEDDYQDPHVPPGLLAIYVALEAEEAGLL